jgi:uncharacterized SAM-binding protein YcdF (DUF218 family)
MEQFVAKFFTSFILPPTGFVVLGTIGLGISFIWKKLGNLVMAISLLSLLICSLPIVSASLLDMLQTDPPLLEKNLKKNLANVDALVLLAGGRRSNAEEFDGDTVSELTLERVRYAAWLAKRTGLPLIVSGGRLNNENKSLAELIQDVLQKEFIVIVDDIETESRNTFENARNTSRILKVNNMRKIALVTHAWHMPRAKKAFEFFEIEVIPAPTAFYGRSTETGTTKFLPSANALFYSGMAFHEMFGAFWYELRYY